MDMTNSVTLPSAEAGAVAAAAPGAPPVSSAGGMSRQWRWLLVAAALAAMATWYLLVRR